MIKAEKIINSEATKIGLFSPEDPSEFENWRKSLDPDVMGFDGVEVGEIDEIKD